MPSDKAAIVSLLAEEWAAIDALCVSLAADDWDRTALPGWDVHDTVAHIVGTEKMLSGDAAPPAPADLDARAHLRNDPAKMNEVWVDAMRSLSHEALLAELREVTARRLAALDAMSDEEFEAPSWTPAGQSTYSRFMRIRIFDCYLHEQDIRWAVGRPGHESGPIAEETIDEVERALGYIVGKRAGAPDQSSVTIALTGPVEREMHVVVDGRAAVVPSLTGDPTVRVAMPSPVFLRLAAGRVDPSTMLDQVTITGDAELGGRVASNLAYTI